MTKKADYPFVSEWRDSGGILRRRFRRRGYAKMLPNDVPKAHSKFARAYAEALERSNGPAARQPASGADSLNAVIERYIRSANFANKAEITRKNESRWFWRFAKQSTLDGKPYGELPFHEIEAENVMRIMEARADQPAAANRIPKNLGVLWRWCAKFDERFRGHNPFKGIEKFKIRSDGYHTWTRAECEQFEARHPSGSMARLAYALLFYTASRRSDVYNLGRQHIDGVYIRVYRAKTRETAEIWMHSELRREIDQAPSDRLTLLVSSTGKPFASAASFGNWFHDRCHEAELPQCTSHGLRKAYAAGAAERGDSDAEIAAVTSHKDPAVLAKYRAKASQRKMAETAVKKWDGEK